MARSRRSLLGAIALLAAVVTVLSGCGTKRVDATASPSASGSVSEIIPPTPSANDFVSAIMLTKIAGSADLDVEAVTSVDGVERRLQGSGFGAVGSGLADLTWVSDAGTTRELINEKGDFVQTDVPGGMWTQLAEGDTTPTTGFANPIRGLAGMLNVVNQGVDNVNGVSATRYTGNIPVDPDELTGFGFSDEEIAAMDGTWMGALVDATVWLDAADRVIRVERNLDLGDASPIPVTAFTATDLSNYGKTISLKVPSSESITKAPDTP